jgi:hypothetical protein
MDDERVMELALQGYGCSQILMSVALEARGASNPELIRAISGLHGGLGFSGKVCGALTGACCVLALYSGKGTPGESEDVCQGPMIKSLVEWFEETYTPRYGGTDCSTILGGDPGHRLSRCPQVLQEVLAQVREILRVNGFDLARDPRAAGP